MNKIIKTISIADDTHPWTVMRAAELLNWIESREYGKYLPLAASKGSISDKLKKIK